MKPKRVPFGFRMERTSRMRYSSGGYSEIFESVKTLEDDPACDVSHTRESLLFEDASQEERLRKRFSNPEESPVITYMVSPLKVKDEFLGVIEVMNRIERGPSL